MFTGFIKTINSKYFKQYVNESSKKISNQITTLKYPSEHNNNELLIKQIILEQNVNLVNFNYNQRPLSLSLMKKNNFLNNFSIFSQQKTKQKTQEEISCQQITQPIKNLAQKSSSITLQSHVQSIQFEANTKIQDAILTSNLQSIDAVCLCVFDGHGGSQLSNYSSKKIVEIIDSFLSTQIRQNQNQHQLNIQSLLKQSICYAYEKIQEQFQQIVQEQLQAGNKQILKCGTCALTVIIYRDMIIIGNAGDSQAIIVTSDGNVLNYFKANQRLSVNNPSEISRLKQQFKDQQILIKNKKNNIYLKGFLQPTRSIGDYYLKKQKYYHKTIKNNMEKFNGPYLSCKPDVNVFKIKESFKNLIIASDGLWDYLGKKEVLKVIEQFNKKQRNETFCSELGLSHSNFLYQSNSLCEHLKDKILQKCSKQKRTSIQELVNLPSGERRLYFDDISIISVNLQSTDKFYKKDDNL